MTEYDDPKYAAEMEAMMVRAGASIKRGKIVLEEAPETPLDSKPACLRTCGTAHRGCDPQCPRRWYEEGQEYGYKEGYREGSGGER